MIPFLLLASLLLIACALLLLRGVFRGQRQQRAEQLQTNIEIARERLAVITAAHTDGEIGEEEFLTEQALIEKQLASELVATKADGDKVMGGGGQWLAIALVPLFIGGVAALYVQLGDTRALDKNFIASMTPGQPSTQVAASAGSDESFDMSAGADGKLPSVEELLPRLESHLESQPDDARGWALLGTSYMRLRRFKDAERALSNAAEIWPEDTRVLLQLADAKAMLADGAIAGDALGIIQQVLKLEPDNVQANWLNGMAAQQQGDFTTAVASWEKLIPQLNGDPQSQQQLQQMVADARAQGGLSESAAAGAPATTANNTENTTDSATAALAAGDAAPEGIDVSVSIRAELIDSVSPETPVFIYARATEGPPMPLAVIRKSVADLPLTVRLDDSLAMMPALKLSSFSNVTVGARVSLSGDPIAQSGDPFGEQVGFDVSKVESPAVAIEISDRVE